MTRHSFWLLSAVIAAALSSPASSAPNAYDGPKTGSVTNPRFSFIHLSDWNQTSNLISNSLRNVHSEPLVALWLDAGIIAPDERPIPPNQTDSNTSTCTSGLALKSSAQLYYGLSQTPKPAPTYICSDKAPGAKHAELNSKIEAHSPKGDFILEVKSIFVEADKQIRYEFTQSRKFYFALPLPTPLNLVDAKGAQVQVVPLVKAGTKTFDLKKYLSNYDSYRLFTPQSLASRGQLGSSTPPVPNRFLAIIVDPDFQIVAGGYVSLYLP